MIKGVLKAGFVLCLSIFVTSCSLNIEPPGGALSEGNTTNEDDLSLTEDQETADTDFESLSDLTAKQILSHKIEDWEDFKEFTDTIRISDEGRFLKHSLSTDILENTAFNESGAITGKDTTTAYSDTNNQVAGVAEADIVKTDGKYIYTLSSNSIFIAEAYPTENMRIVSEIKFKNTPREFFVEGDRLGVIGTKGFVYDFRGYYNNQKYFLKVFDVSDKKLPIEKRHLEIEGNYLDSRMIGDQLYLISNVASLAYMDERPALPQIIEDNTSVSCFNELDCDIPDIYYFELPYERPVLTSLTSLDISKDDADIKRSHYVLPSTQNIYVSKNNLYLTYTKHLSRFNIEAEVLREMLFDKLSEKSRDKVRTVSAVSDFILSDSEKQVKIRGIYEYYISSLTEVEQNTVRNDFEIRMGKKYQDLAKELEVTVIHKIGLLSGDLEFLGSAEVNGYVLNQFSMNEEGDNFFIATSKSPGRSTVAGEPAKSYSNLFAINKDMKVVGKVENLAPGEQIYSVRFMPGRAYMVTFERSDPLFVIDTSKADDLKVLGELKIPGFSNYLHPFDKNTLIGFGRDTSLENDQVIVEGLKISLFDVSDVSAPREIDTQVLGGRGSESLALNDHKAFFFAIEKNILSLPVLIRNSSGGIFGTQDFSGAVVFGVDKDGFTLKGLVEHANIEVDPSSLLPDFFSEDQRQIKRTIYIEDVLYTMSESGIKASLIKGLGDAGILSFSKIEKSNEYEFIINTY